jgi:ribosomal protein L37AE/L43A
MRSQTSKGRFDMPREIIITYWCPRCKKTSVAERNEDGDIECPHCYDASECGAADEMTDEQALIEANAKLLTRGDDSEVVCHEHGVTKRWGDLSSIAQLAVLAGLDVHGDRCVMED